MNGKISNLIVIVILVIILAVVGVIYNQTRYSAIPTDTDKEPTATEEEIEQRTVQFYYYNRVRDLELSGGENVGCSRDAVLPVERKIPVTVTPIQDTIRLLLRGELTLAERTDGFTTEFPGSGLILVGANLENGSLTLGFSDPNNFTTGGSCRVSLLWAQIEKTALQFTEVRQVRFIPEELFQP